MLARINNKVEDDDDRELEKVFCYFVEIGNKVHLTDENDEIDYENEVPLNKKQSEM